MVGSTSNFRRLNLFHEVLHNLGFVGDGGTNILTPSSEGNMNALLLKVLNITSNGVYTAVENPVGDKLSGRGDWN